MKKRRKICYCNTALLLMILLAGCTGSKDEEAFQPSNQASAVQSDENTLSLKRVPKYVRMKRS